MIIAYKDNGCLKIIVPIAYNMFSAIRRNNFLEKENIPISFKDEDLIFASGDLAMPYNVISENLDKLKQIKYLSDVFDNIDVIKELLKKYYLIDPTRKTIGRFIIANKTDAYVINNDFTIYEMGTIEILGTNKTDYSFIRQIIEIEKGSVEERILNAIKKDSMYRYGFESKVVIFDSTNKEYKII